MSQWQPQQYDPRQHHQRLGQPQAQQPYPAPGAYPVPCPQPQYRPPVAIAPKSAGTAVVLSVFFPGAGSIYSGNIATGITILMLWLMSVVLSFFLVGLFGVLVAWIWGLMAAYADAHHWNAAHGFAS